MLSKVIIKNFKSIESLELDLSFAEKKAPNNYKDLAFLPFLEPQQDEIENRLVPIMNIYGANASGKSNIIHSLFCFNRVLLFGVKVLRDIPQELFSVNKLKNLGNNSSLSLEFFIKEEKYSYTLEYNRVSIEKEVLKKGEKELFSISDIKGDFTPLAISNFDNESINNIFNVACIAPIQNGQHVQVNTFLSAIIDKLPGLNPSLNVVLNYLKDSIFISLGNDLPAEMSIEQLSKSDTKEDIDESFRKISRFIQKLDIDIERFEYKREIHSLDGFKVGDNQVKVPRIPNKSVAINEDKNIISFDEIVSIHKNNDGEEVSFQFNEESVGTRLSFGLAGQILRILEIGGVMIIDELDRSLHPLLLKSLIRVFKDKDYNKNNAQLICTLHTTDILEDNIYKVSEFVFINKNPKKGSFLKRLSDFPGIRNDMNFRDRYLNGLYSGIPHPYN